MYATERIVAPFEIRAPGQGISCNAVSKAGKVGRLAGRLWRSPRVLFGYSVVKKTKKKTDWHTRTHRTRFQTHSHSSRNQVNGQGGGLGGALGCVSKKAGVEEKFGIILVQSLIPTIEIFIYSFFHP